MGGLDHHVRNPQPSGPAKASALVGFVTVALESPCPVSPWTGGNHFVRLANAASHTDIVEFSVACTTYSERDNQLN